MIKRGYKLIICLVLVTSLFVGFSVSAFAEPAWLIRAKSAIAAAMLAANLTLEPVDFVLDSTSYPLIDPFGIVDSIGETTIEEYFDKSVIKVLPDVVTIDGVPYSDLWIGPDATDSLRLSGFDFTTAYNILNNQSSPITFANGYGYADGIPLYQQVGTSNYYSALYNISNQSVNTIGNASLEGRILSSNRQIFDITWSDGTTRSVSRSSVNPPYTFQIENINGMVRPNAFNFPVPSYLLVVSPFRFDYTSGVVDAPIAEDDGILIRVPSSYTSQSTPSLSYDIHDLINIYPSVETGHTIEIDPSLNPDFQTDIDLSNDVGDLIHIILQLLDLLDNSTIEYAPEPQPQPEPEPPLPDPDLPISDQDPIWLDSLLRWIQQTIDSIKTVGETIHQDIQDLAESLSELPETILQDIEQAPIKVYQKALDIIKTVFAPVIALLRSVIGLWHYVVEWVTNTAPVFSLFFGLMSSTSYNFVLPIYASLAGVIVIAVYKRFGK